MADRTTKILLAFVAAGLWAAALRPLMSAPPAQAQNRTGSPGSVHMAADSGSLYVLENGRISVFAISREAVMKDGKVLIKDGFPVGKTLLRRVAGPQALRAIPPGDPSAKPMDIAFQEAIYQMQQKDRERMQQQPGGGQPKP